MKPIKLFVVDKVVYNKKNDSYSYNVKAFESKRDMDDFLKDNPDWCFDEVVSNIYTLMVFLII